MNKTNIKNFAIWARNKLIADIQYRAGLMGITAQGIKNALPQSTPNMEFYDIGTAEPYSITGEAIRQRQKLVEILRQKEKNSDYSTAYKYILEEVAYTWFNRLIAIRFMEVNDYLPSHIRVLSSESGKVEPDLVTTPFDAELDFTHDEEDTILRLKNENALDELFRLLFIKQCNALNEILPALFEKTNDYTELMLNLSVVDQDGVVYHLLHDIDEDDFNIEKNGQVEIIGWLYQYYISERHDQIVNIYKGTVKTEDVPAATQLFTTDWVVRYMVDNSLGRYWIERNPQSKLREKLEFFVAPKNGELPLVNEKVDPQELTFFDPCMGSGHILVYAFDVLMEIYTECGYSARNAALEIVSHNLFGLDIDTRAYQLAYFALMMKARQYDRRFFTRGIAPQVYCPRVDKELLENGSLVQMDSLGDKPQEPEELTLFNLNYADDINDWNYRRLLSQKYAVVCTNPPYLNKYNDKLKKFVTENYKDFSGDLFSVFMYRNFGFCKKEGYSAFMTPFVWMSIRTYEKLREFIVYNKNIVSLIQFEYSAFEEATVPICAFILQNAVSDNDGAYFRLSDFKGGMEVQKQKYLEALKNRDCGWYYESHSRNFSRIKGTPITSYWATEKVYEAYASANLDEIAKPRHGLATSDNARFLKLWFEVDVTKASLYAKCQFDRKWFPMNKGGSYRKWYGNLEWVINYEDDGKELKDYAISIYKCSTRTIQNTQFYFKESLTWSALTSGTFSVRWSDEGSLFGSGGYSAFVDADKIFYILALMNSKVNSVFIKIVSPTLNYEVGHIKTIPVVIDKERHATIDTLTKSNITLSKRDWDAFETSWDFQIHPSNAPMVVPGRDELKMLIFGGKMSAPHAFISSRRTKKNSTASSSTYTACRTS